jgi:predicted nucleic acid-binding protein
MKSYTVDSVALLHYLLDTLPEQAQAVVEKAEDGDVNLELPSIVLAETSYILNKRDEIRGMSVRDVSGPEDGPSVLTTIERESPIELVQTEYDELQRVAARMNEFSIHDALVVASHESRNTEAILTKDGTLADSDVPIVWE